MMPFTDQIETLALLRPGERAAGWGEPAWALGGERKVWGEGVSGRAGGARGALWRAVVAGRVAGPARVPGAGALIEVVGARPRARDSAVVIRSGANLAGDAELRRRLRAWGHPALGDDRFGRGAVNWAARRDYGLDRVALHCVGAVSVGAVGDEAVDDGAAAGAPLDPELAVAWRGTKA